MTVSDELNPKLRVHGMEFTEKLLLSQFGLVLLQCLMGFNYTDADICGL